MMRTLTKSLPGIIVALVVINLFVFYPVLDNEFVNWDDDEYVLVNDSIKEISVENLKKIFTENLTGKYHPLTILSFALEYHFFKLDPHYYHATNLLLHILNVLLVFWFMSLLLKDVSMAALVALLFGIHPFQVEPVAWISSRKDMLFMLFYLLGAIVYLRGVDLKDPVKKFQNRGAVTLLFVLSLLSKAMAITFPLVLILIDYYRQKHFDIKNAVSKWPMLAVAFCYGILTMFNAQSSKAFPNTELYPFFERVLYSFFAFVLYLFKIVWPPPLSAFYTFDFTWLLLSLPVLIVVFGGVLIFYSFRKNTTVTFCFLFTILTIWPVLHFFHMNDSIIYDRFMYLPSIGMFILITYGLKRLNDQSNKTLKFIGGAVFILWLVFLINVSHRQTRVWSNSPMLWNNVIKHNPRAYVAYSNMGIYLEQEGRFDEAMRYYMRLIEVNPKFGEGYFKLGNILALKFDRTGAIRYYSKALEYDPKHFTAYNNRGNQYLIAGMYQRALSDYSSAIDINDDYASAYQNRGMCHFAVKDYVLALQDFEKALSLDPDNIRAREKIQFIRNSIRP